MSIDLSQGGRPLSKEEKCTLYSISSEDYFKCLNSADVQLFTQALPAGAVVAIVIAIFLILLALDIKYQSNIFSSFFGSIGNLFSALFSNRVSRRRRY
jgi:hypothetical protein